MDPFKRRRSQRDSLVDDSINKSSIGTRRVQEIISRCNYLGSKKGQDIHTLRKSLKEDEEKAASEKIASRLSAYFASLGNGSNTDAGNTNRLMHSISGGGNCSCWPILDSSQYDQMLDSDSDDLADELYSTVYLGGTQDWTKKSELNTPQASPIHINESRRTIRTAYH